MSRSDRRLNLDWVNVSYRSVLLAALCLVGAVAATWLIWSSLNGRNSPKHLASLEIDGAELLYEEATAYGQEPKLLATRAQAREHLLDARRHFDGARYEEARIKAILSRNNSQKAIDIARSEETTRTEVRFYKVDGEVKVKRAGNLLWEPANINEPLRVGDAIKTSSSGSAQIIYFEGSITTIKPGSLVEITNLVNDPQTRRVRVTESLKVGGVHSSAFGSNAEGSVHEVATQNTVARAETGEKSDFEVDFDGSTRRTDLAVHVGQAEVSSGEKSIVLDAKERVKVAADGRFSAREKVLPAPRPISPSDQKIFVLGSAGPKPMDVVWSEIIGASRYRLEVSRHPLMADLEREVTRRRDTTARLEGLDEGIWYWRVAALAGDGERGRYSEVSQFKIAKAGSELLADREPPDLSLSEVLQTGNLVIINGHTDADARLWVDNQKIDVYEDGTFTAVVRLYREGRNELEIVAQDPAGNETVARREAFLEVF